MSTVLSESAWRARARFDPGACRELMRGGSKTFYAASLLLPTRVREPARALYAFCRVADDETDQSVDPAAAVARLHARLDAIYQGRPGRALADHALAAVVHAFEMPRPLLDALLEGFLWDAQGRQYESLGDLRAYAARVAGTVGAMMTVLMGVRDEACLARACDLGVAMQLTNIARDVGEDARNGRLYLPRSWLREAGIDPEQWLAAPRFDAALGAVIARLLAAADELYARADHGVVGLPRDCRAAIRAASLVYSEIGRELERRGLDAVGGRAVVPARRKLALVMRALLSGGARHRGASRSAPPLPEVAFLVSAAADMRRPVPRSLDERIGWVIGLSERQARQLSVFR